MYPLVNEKLPRFLHGGDYNPEQWPPQIWQEDIRLMKLANANVATVGIFSWVSLQPAPGRFEFGWLDTIMDSLAGNGLFAVLATPSAAHPAWLSHQHPEVLRTDAGGRRHVHGNRGNFCPNSAVYREACAEVDRRLAERYKSHPALLLWHVSNEYCDYCYCEKCATAFRKWLKAKYGSLDELNKRWWTAFWGHTYTDWLQVEPPYEHGERSIPALIVDYARFGNQSLLDCYLNEAKVLREVTPGVPVTTNMMGTCYTTDYRKWSPHVDVVSWDCYPSLRGDVAWTGFQHDVMAGLKGGRPFLLMEQTPSTQNWQAVNALKRPGQMRLWSYLAVAHGADSVMYFQWRRGRGGCEKLHGAIVEHAGHENTRVFREVSSLGAELKQLGDGILGAGVEARVAVVFDWENWWTLENTSGPIKDKKYCETVFKHYRAFWRRNVPVAVIGADDDLTKYDILIAPMLYMCRLDFAEKVEQFVEEGGRFLTTCLSGWVDETDLAYMGGYPGPLRKVTGVWVEEIDALFEDQRNRIIMKQSFGPCRGEYVCARLCDRIHAETASVLATFGQEFYAGWPAVTENQFGNGYAYYIGTDPEPDFLLHFCRTLCVDTGVSPVLESPAGVEVRRRSQKDRSFLFVLNHNDEASSIVLPDGRYRDMLTGQQLNGNVPVPGLDLRIVEELPEAAPLQAANSRRSS
jgi:beta-galactosidase